MPRGKYVNHKGRNRHFTSPEELEAERANEAKKKWRNKQDESSEEEDGEEGSAEGSDDSEEESEEEAKGAGALIDIQNPNRQPKKAFVKATEVEETDALQLSRREREQIEKQKAQAAYMKRHAEGKTSQAKADLARLAIIKQHRAEAAARREAEKKSKDSK